MILSAPCVKITHTDGNATNVGEMEAETQQNELGDAGKVGSLAPPAPGRRANQRAPSSITRLSLATLSLPGKRRI